MHACLYLKRMLARVLAEFFSLVSLSLSLSLSLVRFYNDYRYLTRFVSSWCIPRFEIHE